MAAAAVVLVLPTMLAGAGGSLLDAAVGSSCASAAGTIHVGLVIDYGTVDSAGSSRSTTRECVTLPDSGGNRSGANALMAADHVLRWSSSGLLCAIDGYPATGCGEASTTGYRYWSYWHGGDSWSYSSVGPDSFTPRDGAVEGWHFVDGTGTTDSGRVPRSASNSPCPAPPGSTTPPTTPVTTAATTPADRRSGGDGSVDGSAAPTSSIVDGASSTIPGDASTAVPGAGDGGASESIAGPSPDGSTGSDPGAAGALGANAPASSLPSGSQVPIGVILLAVAVVVLAGSAFVRFRTRPAP
jgi:hypothetical protein